MKISSGILLYRAGHGGMEVLLVHPGGPFWAKKDAGAWTIPKGEVDGDEDYWACAKREFKEEMGVEIFGDYDFELEPVKQAGGKVVHAFVVDMDIDETAVKSNTFALEWPPKSGRMQQFPEIDRAQWFDMETARTKINPAQVALLDDLQSRFL